MQTIEIAIVTNELAKERDLLKRIVANHEAAMGLIATRMCAAGLSSMTIHGEEGGYFGQAASLMDEARALLGRTATPEPKAAPAWVDVALGDFAQLGDRIFSGGKAWQTIDEECGLVGREITDAWWPVQRRAK